MAIPNGFNPTVDALTVIGATTGIKKTAVVTTSDTDTLTAQESGSVIIATKSSATQTFTLPSAATGGVIFTFVCGHASGEILINPIAGQTIQTKATGDGGALVAPAAGTGIKNTAATNVIGDHVTLVSNGVTGWYTIGQSGIWASQ